MLTPQKYGVRLGRVWLALAPLLVGCPGYLEEQAFFADGGRAVSPASDGPVVSLPPASGTGGVMAPPASPGTGGSPAAAPPPAPAPMAVVDAGTGAGAGGPAAGTPPPVRACATGSEIVAKILMPKCSGCHSPAKLSGNLDLTTMGAKARLLNVAAKCAGKTLAVDSPSVGGHFFDKLAGPVANCGGRMPAGGGAALSADEIDCLKEWIKPAGTPPPPPPPPPPNPAAGTPCSDVKEITTKIFTPKCAPCHGIAAAGNLDLLSAGSKARLVGVISKTPGCNKPLVTAEGEVTGVFFDKLIGDVAGCGKKMPFDGSTLSPLEIQCIKDWIRPSTPPAQ